MATNLVRTGLVEANGTQLYHEVRGDGPPVVCISGGAGDAAYFEPLAELFADTYRVLTYDRRGLSRSPRPAGWTATSIEEQADDCAALIPALGLERPVVMGHSLGGTIVVSMVERHARLLRGAIVLEPGLPSVVGVDAEFTQKVAELMAEGLAAGGSVEVLDRMSRWFFGDAAWEAVPEELRARSAANAEVNQSLEFPAIASFQPDAKAVAAADIPVHAAYGAETGPPITWAVESARWVSKVSGGLLHAFPGDHLAIVNRPAELVDALRPILESMT